jgi:hypothetical protein
VENLEVDADDYAGGDPQNGPCGSGADSGGAITIGRVAIERG